MNPTNSLRLLLGLAAVLLAAVMPGWADDSLQRVRQNGTLRIAIDPTYPPMEFEKDGQPVGFDVDFGQELARRLGVQARFISMDWAGIIVGLNSNRYDLIISSMNITEEREREVDFVPYMAMYQVFVCREGITVVSEEDLEGKIVAVQASTTSHSFVQRLHQKGLNIEIRDLPNATDTFNALKGGQAHVVVTDEPVGRYYARLDKDFAVTGVAMDSEPVGVALRKQDRELQAVVAAAVADMKADGTLRRTSEKWFGGLAQFAPSDFWTFSREVVLPRILSGMGLTLALTALSGAGGIALGLLLSLARISRRWPLHRLALGYVTLFRGTPLLLQIFVIFYALPSLGVRLNALTSGVLALALNAAAYITEIFRAAIQSIDRGQMEAARALGMSYGLAMRRVILPQTFRRLIPPLVNELAALAKDSSLVSVLALHEMLYETNRIAAA